MLLAFDTATPFVTVALHDGESVVAEARSEVRMKHGEHLAPLIEAVLRDAGVVRQDLTALAVGTGPGPFTGLRVGLVTAAAMGQALAIPTYGVCSLDALGRAAGPGRVLVATDARRKEVYFAAYTDGVRSGEPDVARPGDVTVTADRAVGEGALKYSEIFGVPIDDRLLYPPGEALVALAADRIRTGRPSERLTPLYLRRPDAVESVSRKTVLQ